LSIALGFGIQEFCWGSDYFIDPTSTSVIELGTLKFPYKSVSFAFIEIFNFWTDFDQEIWIQIKENTLNQLKQQAHYVLNLKNLTLTTYWLEND